MHVVEESHLVHLPVDHSVVHVFQEPLQPDLLGKVLGVERS